ncbi:MAG: deoxyribonuclease IV [Candidatus Babeliales bacterium]
MKKEILLGAHVSIQGGLYKAIERGEKMGCSTIQIFTQSNQSWFAKKLLPEEIEKFKKTLQNSKIKIVISHSTYLINIGSPNKETEKKSVHALITKLEKCNLLDIPYIVLHPGSHLGSGEENCIKKIAKNLDFALSKSTGKTKILIETVAGQGTNIGYTFEQLKQIKDLCKLKNKIAICFDTCHVFSAGYDISTPEKYEEVLKNFDKILGLNLLKVIHLNNSKTEFNSKKDRHENIIKGQIPIKFFELIMNDKRFIDIPKILETPIITGENTHEQEIKLLKKMVNY